jgi:hypothetical protein
LDAIQDEQNRLTGLIDTAHNAANVTTGGGSGGGFSGPEEDELDDNQSGLNTYQPNYSGSPTSGSGSSSSSSSDEAPASSNSSTSGSGGGYTGGFGSFTSSSGGGGGGGRSSATKQDKDQPAGSSAPAEAPASAPTEESRPAASFAFLTEEFSQAAEKAQEVLDRPAEQVSAEEIKEVLQKVEEISQKSEEVDESPGVSQGEVPEALEEKKQLQEQTSQLAISLEIELIKRTSDLAQACQLACQAINKYARQQGLTDFDFKESQLAHLNTSQAVAHEVQEVVKQIQQQKLQKTSLDSSARQGDQRWLPWAIGGGVLMAALVGTAAWYLNKVPNKPRPRKTPTAKKE